MQWGTLAFAFVLLLVLSGVYFWVQKKKGEPAISELETGLQPESASSAIPLPVPKTEGEMSLEEAMQKRRSQRDFLDKPLTLEHFSQIIWAGQGVTDSQSGFRTAPSAGALYPLEAYVVVGENSVGKLAAGVYHYLPENHSLAKILDKDRRSDLREACWGQSFVATAPVSLVIAVEYERTTGEYGERGIRYTHLEVGHAAENVYLQVTALGLGTVAVGAFDDEEVAKVLNLPSEHKPLCVMPIGYPS